MENSSKNNKKNIQSKFEEVVFKRRSSVFLILWILAIIIAAYVVVQTPHYQPDTMTSTISRAETAIGIVNLYGPISFEMVDSVLEQLDRYSESDSIIGIILRINSPGGEPGSTQEIYDKIISIRDGGKPVYASIGNIAASGGYYIACACEKIFTNASALTGSIGVIISTYNFAGLMAMAGVQHTVIKHGEYKDILSMSRFMTEEEKELMQTIVDDTFEKFYTAVKDARLGVNELTEEQLQELTEGQVFTGSMAMEYGLVDNVGGLQPTIDALKEKLGLSEEEIPIIKPEISPFENLFKLLEGASHNQLSLVDYLLKHYFSSPVLYLYTG